MNRPAGHPAGSGRGRTFVFGALYVVLVLLVLEGGVRLLLVARGTSVGELASLRDVQAGVESPDPLSNEGGPSVLHPYFGFVLDGQEFPEAQRGDPEAVQYGFPWSRVSPFAEDRAVVAFFGGSFARQMVTAAEAELTTRLEASGVFGERPVAIVNLAAGGWKQPQQLLAFETVLALGADPAVVVLLDGFNEVALPTVRNLTEEVHPYFPTGWRLRVQGLGREERRLLGRVDLWEEIRRKWALAMRRFGSSAPGIAAWKIGDGWVDHRILEVHERLAEGKAGDDFQARGPHEVFEDWDSYWRSAVGLWERSSVLMADACRSRGVPFLHFLQPNQYVDGSKPLTEEERTTAWNPHHPFRRAVGTGYPLLLEGGERLRESGVEFRSLVRVFEDRRETLWADTCCHANPAGYRLVAEHVAEEIVRVAAALATPEPAPAAVSSPDRGR